MELFSALKEFAAVTQSLGFVGILFFVWWQGQKERKEDNKKWEERFQAVVKMHEESVRRYEDNVILAKDNQKLGERYEKMNSEVLSVVSYNSQVMTSLTELVKDMKEDIRRERYES